MTIARPRLMASAALLGLATAALSAEATYRNDIKPLFDAKCANCHGSDSAPELHAFKEERDKWLALGGWTPTATSSPTPPGPTPGR